MYYWFHIIIVTWSLVLVMEPFVLISSWHWLYERVSRHSIWQETLVSAESYYLWYLLISSWIFPHLENIHATQWRRKNQTKRICVQTASFELFGCKQKDAIRCRFPGGSVRWHGKQVNTGLKCYFLYVRIQRSCLTNTQGKTNDRKWNDRMNRTIWWVHIWPRSHGRWISV